MKNIFYIILVSVLISSCNRDYKGNISMQPYSLNLEPPPGPAEYRQGWADGCESGANAYSDTFYKMSKAFDYRFDASLRNNQFYYQAWKDAFFYCSVFWERTNGALI